MVHFPFVDYDQALVRHIDDFPDHEFLDLRDYECICQLEDLKPLRQHLDGTTRRDSRLD